MSNTEIIDINAERKTNNALTPMEMLNGALERGSDAETLGKLMDLQERWQDREAKSAYDSDMAAMQGELPVIEKKREGHGWKYADWGDIKRQINPVLTKYGFAVTHRTEARENDLIVTAICSHRDGHREETSLPLPYDTSGSKNATQARGSTVQYGFRYTGCAIIGVAVGGEDKDGETLSEGGLSPREAAAPFLEMIDAQDVSVPSFKDRLQKMAKEKKLPKKAFDIVKSAYAKKLAEGE